LIRRWLKFNAVGVAGAVVQLAVLAALRGGMGLEIGVATALAVEAALLHNFFWHERWTWATRGQAGAWARLGKFHLGNGVVSLVSNVVWMEALVGVAGVGYLEANVVSITATALANFLLGEKFVFAGRR
jgi:putative flippase GtrA